MFERYTEKARRVIFFGRYEASGFGDSEITSEHLFLGLVKEDAAMLHEFVPSDVLEKAIEEIRYYAELRNQGESITPTSVDLPLSDDAKQVLISAAAEAELLNNPKIEPEHLLLGIVREETGGGGRVLRRYGLVLDALRKDVRAKRPAQGTYIGEFQTVAPQQNFRQMVVVDSKTESSICALPMGASTPIPREGETVVIEQLTNTKNFRVERVLYHFAVSSQDQLQSQLLKVVLRVTGLE